ncbi:hypothetical protein [Chlorogloeopsis sp. ULAP02]
MVPFRRPLRRLGVNRRLMFLGMIATSLLLFVRGFISSDQVTRSGYAF